ncbi:MAG: GNAT family N-acetyltransferase [Anaerolineae bacterium]|nr:GNAT family N-acetyltransferase [Anaerolineae bacterium]
MPILETERMIIRPFAVDDVERIAVINEELDAEINREYVLGTIASGRHLANLHQPPYGERAGVLKSENLMICAVGLVPCLMPFEQLPTFANGAAPQAVVSSTAEVGLYWACDPAYRQRGIATEAARALIDYAFDHLHIKRIIATTEYDNLASQGVMRKLGMTIEHNPLPDPFYMQVVGILENGA